jgi:hypothetical protein
MHTFTPHWVAGMQLITKRYKQTGNGQSVERATAGAPQARPATAWNRGD